MRVLLDAFPLLAPKSGVGYYALNLVKALAGEFPEDEYVYFYGRRFSTEILETAPSFDAGLRTFLKKSFRKPYRLTQPLKELFFRFGAPRQKADVYHELNYVPLPYKGPQVVTVFDMSLIRYPMTHPADRRSYFESYFPKRLKNADHFITISDFSKKELTELYGVPEEKITTVYLGGLAQASPDAEKVAAFKKEKKLPERYFLYCGNLEPRKNLPLLIRAYARALKKEPSLPNLVLVGAPSWLSEDIFSAIEKESLGEKVLVTGYVPYGDLPFYYAGAAAFFFPSLYEGFGLPVLEAMEKGLPVAASSSSSLPEVLGDAGLLIHPEDADGWTEALLRLSLDEGLRTELSQKSLERAKLFSWQRAARETRAVYEKTLSLYF
ncbi:glycosyltransferase family 4 protein [bacterium]|nr:glycosyltransferase family 4 protein [bacterium]